MKTGFCKPAAFLLILDCYYIYTIVMWLRPELTSFEQQYILSRKPRDLVKHVKPPLTTTKPQRCIWQPSPVPPCRANSLKLSALEYGPKSPMHAALSANEPLLLSGQAEHNHGRGCVHVTVHVGLHITLRGRRMLG